MWCCYFRFLIRWKMGTLFDLNRSRAQINKHSITYLTRTKVCKNRKKRKKIHTRYENRKAIEIGEAKNNKVRCVAHAYVFNWVFSALKCTTMVSRLASECKTGGTATYVHLYVWSDGVMLHIRACKKNPIKLNQNDVNATHLYVSSFFVIHSNC